MFGGYVERLKVGAVTLDQGLIDGVQVPAGKQGQGSDKGKSVHVISS
jgi:hypothetical protein